MGARALASLSWVVPGNSWVYVHKHGSGIPFGMQPYHPRDPVVVPPATLERRTGYLLPTLRVGVAIGREWEDLIPPALARANPSLMQLCPYSPCEHQHLTHSSPPAP